MNNVRRKIKVEISWGVNSEKLWIGKEAKWRNLVKSLSLSVS